MSSNGAYARMMQAALPHLRRSAENKIQGLIRALAGKEAELRYAIDRRKRIKTKSVITALRDHSRLAMYAQLNVVRAREPQGSQNFAAIQDPVAAAEAKAAWESAKDTHKKLDDFMHILYALEECNFEDPDHIEQLNVDLLTMVTAAKEMLSAE